MTVLEAIEAARVAGEKSLALFKEVQDGTWAYKEGRFAEIRNAISREEADKVLELIEDQLKKALSDTAVARRVEDEVCYGEEGDLPSQSGYDDDE
jgi:hypothetical protein